MILVFSTYNRFRNLVHDLTVLNKVIKVNHTNAIVETEFGTFKWMKHITAAQSYDINTTQYYIINISDLTDKYLNEIYYFLRMRPYKQFILPKELQEQVEMK